MDGERTCRAYLQCITQLLGCQCGREPTEKEQKGLIEDFVRSEIYYREAIAIGLDRDDEVLKRRLRQKMEFIYEDITSLAEPTDEDRKTFMENHREKYLADPRIAFRQVYVNTAQRGTDAELTLTSSVL